MAENVQNSTDIKETDIVFDCPHCSKSLAIDYRGAGLSIPCTDCGRYVEVPIPEGMELTDIDSSDEEQEIRILNLRRSLTAAEFRIEHLESQLAQLGSRRDTLEKEQNETLSQESVISEKVDELRSAVDRMAKVLADITTTLNRDS